MEGAYILVNYQNIAKCGWRTFIILNFIYKWIRMMIWYGTGFKQRGYTDNNVFTSNISYEEFTIRDNSQIKNFNYTYDEMGYVETVSNSNITITYDYDSQGRLKSELR